MDLRFDAPFTSAVDALANQEDLVLPPVQLKFEEQELSALNLLTLAVTAHRTWHTFQPGAGAERSWTLSLKANLPQYSARLIEGKFKVRYIFFQEKVNHLWLFYSFFLAF